MFEGIYLSYFLHSKGHLTPRKLSISGGRGGGRETLINLGWNLKQDSSFHDINKYA